MEGDGMSAADKIKEADWRLFRSRLPIWQEAYMERLNREYIALLSGTGSASEKFWELERRMREDKRRPGGAVRLCFCRTSPKNHGFELGRIAISLCGQFFYKRTGVDFHDLGDSTTKINLFAHLR